MNYPTDSEMFTVACLVNTPAWLIPEQAKKATQDLFTDDRAAIVIGALIHLSHEENQPDDEPIRFQVLDRYLKESGLYSKMGTPLAEWVRELVTVRYAHSCQFDSAVYDLISDALHREINNAIGELREADLLKPDGEYVQWYDAHGQRIKELDRRRNSMFTRPTLHVA